MPAFVLEMRTSCLQLEKHCIMNTRNILCVLEEFFLSSKEKLGFMLWYDGFLHYCLCDTIAFYFFPDFSVGNSKFCM